MSILVRLRSSFTDLKFGADQPGYGSSGQPFIQTALPISRNARVIGPNAPIYKPGTTGGLDYPARGGAPAFNRGLQTVSKFNDIDKLRIERFLKSAPRGTAFIQKQIGLQLSNPKMEVDTTGLGGPGEFGPLQLTRVYNSSNTLEQVGVQGTGAHGIRHGFLAFPRRQNNYFETVNKQITLSLQGEDEEAKESNRLLMFYALKMSTSANPRRLPDFGLNLQKINDLGISLNRNTLFEYLGGPSSVYGLGSTVIPRATDTTKLGTSIFSEIGKRVMTYDLLRAQGINSGSRQQGVTKFNIQDFREKISETEANPILADLNKKYVPWEFWGDLPGTVDSKRVGSRSNDNYLDLKRKGYEKIVEKNSSAFGNPYPTLEDFREVPKWFDRDSIDSKFYTTYFVSGKRERFDKINASYPFIFDNKNSPWSEVGEESSDLIKFVFEAISNDDSSKSVAIFFRAFLNGNITDNHGASWNAFKYFGRGEEFYTYQGFTRGISFSFNVVAQSKRELQPMYNRLNALVSQVYPDYSRAGIMRAPIIRLTVGDYIYRMAGFLESVNVTLSSEAAWEIEDGRQLPFKAEVQVSFKPIPEDLPRRYRENNVPKLMIQNSSNLLGEDDAFIKGNTAESNDAFSQAPVQDTPQISRPQLNIAQNSLDQLDIPQSGTPQEEYYKKINNIS